MKQEKSKKRRSRKLTEKTRVEMRNLFLNDLDDLIKDFGIDKEMDQEKINSYFKELEDSIFDKMKKKLLSDQDYTKQYSVLKKQYQDMKNLYK